MKNLYRPDGTENSRLWAFTIVSFLITALCCTTVVVFLDHQLASARRSQAVNLAQTHLRSLSTNISQALSAAYALSALVRQGNGTIQDFDRVAGEMLQLYPGVGALQLVPDGIVRKIVPLEGNEKAIGHNLLKDPERTREAFLARSTGKLTLAGPFDLVQGGQGAVGRLPVFLGDQPEARRFWGFTTVLIKFPDIIVASGLPEITRSGYDYELWKLGPSGKKQVISASLRRPLAKPVEITLSVPNGEWILGVSPRTGWHNPPLIILGAVLGLCMSLMSASFIHMLLRQPIILRKEVADRTRALQESKAILHESEQKFRLAFENANTGMCLVSLSGDLMRVNNKMTEIFGYGRDEFERMNVMALAVQEDAIASAEFIEQALSSGVDDSCFEQRYIHKDGHLVWGYVSSSLVRNAAGEAEHFICQILDLTENKQMEEERRSMERQLLHAQKLESLGVLAGGIAHDFNNIMMVVMGNAELARAKIGQDAPGTDNLGAIEKAAERAAALSRQMLAYSGKGAFFVEAVNLNQVVEDVAGMLEVSISKKTAVRYNLMPDIPHVEGDATQLRQIIMNLVINASEALEDHNGFIAIATGVMECDRDFLKNAWLDEQLPEGRYVFLEVTDNGCGMDSDTLSKMFDPFFTTKFTGRGLGMAAVLGIVRGHHGTIQVSSEPGKGSSFRVFLPAVGQGAHVPDPQPCISDWKGTGVVLLADDEEQILDVGSEMLRELGFDVITAHDGREALRVFQEHEEAITCVILDMNMPQLDGEETFRELKRLNPQVRVIISSGFSEQETCLAFAGSTSCAFLQKPYRLPDLAEKLRKM